MQEHLLLGCVKECSINNEQRRSLTVVAVRGNERPSTVLYSIYRIGKPIYSK